MNILGDKIKKFVIGDLHGRIEALKEVLKKSKFDREKDKLICLGDVCDGGYNTYECVEELLKIKNLVLLLGNHDFWFLKYISSGWSDEIWTSQGGQNTLDSYKKHGYDFSNIPVTHQDFFNRGKYYHIENNDLFVHGGFDPIRGLLKTPREVLLWDRDLINFAQKQPIPLFKRVFIGHTSTQMFSGDPSIKDCMRPVKLHNLIMCDTGVGNDGRLALMYINSEEVWVSKVQKPAV